MSTSAVPDAGNPPEDENVSPSFVTGIGTAEASHPDPSTLTEAEKRHLGIS